MSRVACTFCTQKNRRPAEHVLAVNVPACTEHAQTPRKG